MNKKRCNWSNLQNNEIYKEYHDNEWGIASYEDDYLFEMILLESFHCGLSWLIILKKREAFRKAFDNFNPNIIVNYKEDKVLELMQNKDIVRNEAKIVANIQNAKSFLKVQNEFDSFSNYIWSFTNNKVVVGNFDDLITKNELSDMVCKDMKKEGLNLWEVLRFIPI